MDILEMKSVLILHRIKRWLIESKDCLLRTRIELGLEGHKSVSKHICGRVSQVENGSSINLTPEHARSVQGLARRPAWPE